MPVSEYNVNINITTRDKTSEPAKAASKSLFTLANAAKVAAAAYAVLRTAQKAVEFVKLGADVQMAERRLVAFAGGVEQAAKYMEALAAGSDYTIDRMTGLAQASRMLETGMVNNAREMELAAAMVAKLGNQTRSTESRMQMLTLLLANQSILRLDEFGLSIDRVRERQKALEQQGLSTSAAFRGAVFAEAEEKLAILGDTSTTTATKIAQVEAAWKTMVQTIAESAATDLDPTLGNMAKNIRDLTVLYQGLMEISKREPAGFQPPTYTPPWQEYQQENQTLTQLILSTESLRQTRAVAAITTRGWQEDEEELRRALEETNAALRAQQGHTVAITQSMLDSLSMLGQTDQGLMDYLGTLGQAQTMASGFTAYVDDGSMSLREQAVAAKDAAFALQDLAMAYASYNQQVAYSYADYAGSLEEIEARYQESVQSITEGGAAGGGGAAAKAREFDRADIERGLNILQLQLKELEAERAKWDQKTIETEPVFWYELSRQDRKWLLDHGKTLEDLKLKREETLDEVSELERAQTEDRIEDLKKEIAETKKLLEIGHYEQSAIRVGGYRRDTAALLAAAADRRDKEIAALEKSQARQETMHRESLGRIKLAAFENWLAMQTDTDTWTAAQWKAVEQMRLNILLEYGLITPGILAETAAWTAAFDATFTSIASGVKNTVSELQKIADELAKIPAEKRIKIITEISREETHGGTVPTLTQEQHGGPVKAGYPYLVGEEGPELFVPSSSGQIVNNTRTEQIIGSHNVYNINDARAMAFLALRERMRMQQAYVYRSGM